MAFGGTFAGVVVAEDDTPGDPASFFGNATDEGGDAIPEGTPVVAVVDGETRDSIAVDPAGEYGGEGAFDEKLRVDGDSGEAVTFRIGDADGPIGGTADLEPGVFEEDLQFPADAAEYVDPEAVATADPDPVPPGGEVTLSASESSAHDDTTLVEYSWVIVDGSETVATFDGETAVEQFEESGTYSVELDVVDAEGRSDTATATFEVDPDADSDSESGGETGSDDHTEGTGSDSGETEADGNGGEDGSTDDGGGSSGGGSASGSTSASSGGSGSSGDSSGGSSSSGSGGGSSGGSGSSVPEDDTDSRDPILEDSVRIDDDAPEEPGTTVTFGNTTLREVVLDNASARGTVSISEFDGIAEERPPLPGDLRIVSTSVITVPSANRDEPASVRAAIDPERLREKEILPDRLEVYRLPSGGDEWQPLPTETAESDEGIVVDAETPGFSRFVVAGPPTPELIGSEATPDVTPEPSTETPEASDERTETPESAPGSFVLDRIGIDRSTAAFVALVAIIAVLGRIFIPRRRR